MTLWSEIIAKNQNTFAKRQREMEKKFKAQEKLSRRMERKLAQGVEEPQEDSPDSAESDEDLENSDI